MKHYTAAILLCIAVLTRTVSAASYHEGFSPSAPVYALIERICPGSSGNFIILIDTAASGSFFELSQSPDGRVSISADCPVSATVGLNWYLKYYAGIHLSWNCMRAELPAELPPVPAILSCRRESSPAWLNLESSRSSPDTPECCRTTLRSASG